MNDPKLSQSNDRGAHLPPDTAGLALLNGPTAQTIIERERRYIISMENLENTFKLEELPSLKINQSYFPSKLTKTMALLSAELLHVEIPEGTKFSQARLRHYHDAFGPHYEIHAKGHHDDLANYERIELGAPISKEFYLHLFKQTTAGTVEKTRYKADGHIIKEDGTKIFVFAEIDVFEKCGRKPKPIKGEPLFAFVEVELASPELARRFAEGHHTFDFLQNALEIEDQQKRFREVLNNTYIARHGIDSKVRSLSRELLS